MSVNIPNVSKKEKSLTQTIEDILATSGASLLDGDYGDIAVSAAGQVMTVEAAGSNIFLPAGSTATVIQAAMDSLTTGGTVWLAAGTYTLSAGLNFNYDGVTLRGAGPNYSKLYYTADANTDIITIKKSYCTVRDLFVSGSTTYGNGYGAVGTGRGIVIADTTSTCVLPTIRNVEVANTGSWCIYSKELYEMTDLGTGTSPNRDYGYPLVAVAGGYGTVCLTLDNVLMSFPNSGGCLCINYGASACRISGIKTNAYSFGTYARIDSAGGVATDIGSVHLNGVTNAVFDNKCVFQSPSAQSGSPTVAHDDTDATMLSFLNCSACHFEAPYFEVLSSACAGGSVVPTAAGRNHWFITAINTSGLTIKSPYMRSAVVNAGTYYPLRIFQTPADSVSSGLVMTDGAFFHARDTYTSVTAVPPYEAGDPATRDRDDFVFGGFSDGEKEAPILVENCNVINLSSGKMRDPTTPASAATGYTIVSKQAVSFSNAEGPIQLGRFDDCNPASVIGTSGTPDDLRSRWSSNHAIYGGVLGYVRGTGAYTLATTKNGTTTLTSAALFGNVEVGNAVSGTGIPANSYVVTWTDSSTIVINNAATDSLTSNLTFTINGTSQREGLWLSSHRSGPDFRQIPYIRTYTTEMPGKLAGDLWMQLTGTPVSSVYPTAQFWWYDGSAWQAPLNRSVGTAAGDLIKYTASDTPARLAIGSTGDELTVSGGAPVWSAPSGRSISLLGSAAIDMKTAGTTTIYTTPTGKVTRVTHVVVRDATATLAGGTDYSVTNFRQNFSLAALTTSGTGYVVVQAADLAQYTETAASTAIQLTVTTGSTGAATATVDVFGYTT